ncbi:dihydroorotase [Neoasaia chiangmaiensis]|uniref:Dihydroorotase n=1 Tax=Neoasaia chiangmaiensis TaxID=320497 RepID=A0A1U9KUF2_9PROT|nr:dihydroorotase [Neoasaia chiangmaiensis]AQS89476.1 dihydroorotase [Neoasaia chiangmaiensis]
MQHFDIILRSGTIVADGAGTVADIGCRDGRIVALGDLRAAHATDIIDCRGLHVLPGIIDPHVHLRDPGDPAVETIPDGTRAAVLGGVTAVFDMPNTQDPVISAAALDRKRTIIAAEAWCDVGLYVGGTKGNIADLGMLEAEPNVCAIKVFAGSAPPANLVEDDVNLEALMRSGARTVCYHSEDEARLQARRALFGTGEPYRMHMQWRDEECAFLGTRRLMALARKTGRRAHILHVSTAEELAYMRDFKGLGTVEVLVNHLTQVGPEVYDRLGGYAIMNPPIRDRRHYEAAWAAVNAGDVDCIGSDHAPHSREAKERPWPLTAAGLTGVQTLVPIMLDHVAAERLSLHRMAQLMSSGPARVYGAVGKGRIAVGYDADFTVVDLRKTRVIEESWIASPCGWTPFAGQACTGWPIMTIVRGHTVMREDEVLDAPAGRLVSFA